ncbi:MAG: type II toxin-antitoxin system HicA family toxin [Candidatus Zixiibacteriota bacterium]
MSKPTLTLREVRKKLTKLGFKKVREGRKHEIWDNGSGHIVPISPNQKDVGKTLLKSICHELGMSKKDFLAL